MIDLTEQFLRLDAVMAKTGKSKAAIYRDMQLGAFPSSVKIGARAVAWRLSQVAVWMASPKDYHCE
jgi:prophage regulatory protein